ncbi:hypothetical protein C0J45_1174, partial [Silurus meridionalis]
YVLFSMTGDSMADSIEPLFTHKAVGEGENVILSCKYKTLVNNLQWYKQHPKSRPKFLFYITPTGYTSSRPPRLNATVKNEQVDLIISFAAVSDSALYYCALEPTVTGNPAVQKQLLCTKTLTPLSGSFADKIGPTDKDANVVRKETNTVTLKCSYESNSNYIRLYWYKQYPHSAPQFLLYKGAKSESDKIGPTDKDAKVVRKETNTVTLKCSYESNSNYIRLYWYKQYPHSAPQFLLYKGAKSESGYDYNPSGSRFRAETTSDATELFIKDLQISDSALYHCAL